MGHLSSMEQKEFSQTPTSSLILRQLNFFSKWKKGLPKVLSLLWFYKLNPDWEIDRPTLKKPALSSCLNSRQIFSNVYMPKNDVPCGRSKMFLYHFVKGAISFLNGNSINLNTNGFITSKIMYGYNKLQIGPYLWHIVWKMSHLKFSILAPSTNFCAIKSDMSSNTVWP